MNTAQPREGEAPAEPSLRASAAALARGWNSFFHAPCDARICAAIRIAYALLVLVHFATLYPDLDLWFTEAGVLPLEAARKVVSPFSVVRAAQESGQPDNERLLSLLELMPKTSAAVHVC